MRKSIRFLCVSIAVILGIGMLPQAKAATEISKTENSFSIVMNENFESYNVGTVSATTLGGGTAKTNLWTIEQETEKSNKYFKMDIVSTSDAHLDRTISPAVSGQFVFEMDVCFYDYGNVSKNIQFMDSENKDIQLVKFTPQGTLTTYDGTEAAKYALNKFYRMSIAVDTYEQTMSVYFNGKRRLKNYKLSLNDAAKFRIHMTSVKENSAIAIDNISIYYATEPISDEDKIKLVSSGNAVTQDNGLAVAQVMKNAVALYVGKGNALVNGVKKYISSNEQTSPKFINGKIVVPVRFFGESVGARVDYSAEENSCTLSTDKIIAKFFAGSKKMLLNGNEEALSVEAQILSDGCLYAPIEELCKVFDKYLHREDNGIIIYSDNDMSEVLDWGNNLKLMRNISESYMFDDVDGETIVNKLKIKNPNNKHPRLIMTEDNFVRIRNELANPNGDEVYKRIFEGLRNKADNYLTQKTSGYEIRDGIRLLSVVRENKERMLTLALVYNLTLDEKYAERAYREMYTMSCFVDWNPYHFLDVGEAAASVGICYDWLYNYMTEQQRKPVREAIVKNAIYPIIDDFDDKPRNRSWDWRGELADNWCFVVAGVGVGTLAVADELSGQDLINAQRVLSQTLIDIRRALSLFAPNGGYEEGINYWGLTMEFFTYHMKSFETAVGEDFGYLDVPGMRNTNQYVFSMNGSVSTFSYHDTGMSTSLIPPETMFLADAFGKYGEALPRINKLMNGAIPNYMDMCLYKPEFLSAEASANPLDTYMPVAETVTMRSGWSEDDIYVGFHCDDPYGSSGHDHMDSGQFVLDSMGQNFFLDLGSDSYNLNPYHDTYRFRAEGHNTIILNPSEDYGQKYGGKAFFEKYEFSETGGFAIGNLTGAYDDNISESIRRGIKFDNFRRMVTVQDEVRLKKPSEFYWFGHTRANIELSEDGKSAILERNGKKLLAKIISGEGAVFSVMEATPLPTSPVVKGQATNDGIRKLTVNIKECTELDLGIVFVNYDEEYEEENYNFEYIALDDWKVSDAKMSDLKKATVNSIVINGKPLEGFSPDKYEYDIPVMSLENSDDVIDVKAEGEIEIEKKTSLAGTTYITAKKHGNKEKSIYKIKYNVVPTLVQPAHKKKISPISVKASDIPQPENSPENTIDGSLNTRWSAVGECWIEYDLGAVYNLDSVGVAFMEGTTRTAQFDIQISEDGLNYTTFFSGDAINTLELDNHELFGAKARYVRVNCYGYNNNRSAWNSLTEFICYEK